MLHDRIPGGELMQHGVGFEEVLRSDIFVACAAAA